MRRFKRFLTGVLANAMALSMIFASGTAMTANAAQITKASGVSGNSSIQITLAEDRTGDTTYHIYKVFDATSNGTNIAYTPVASKSDTNLNPLPTNFEIKNGYVNYKGSSDTLSETEIESIREYIKNDTAIATVVATKDEDTVTVDGLPLGYYFIDTTVGSLVVINTSGVTGIADKNSVPGVDNVMQKAGLSEEEAAALFLDDDSKKAIAEVGKKVPYKVTIKVGKGSKNLEFHDVMSSGLTYNNDVSWTPAVSGNIVTPDENETIKVKFADGIAEGTEIVVTYTATINNEALKTDSENNKAYLKYGEDNKTDEKQTFVYDAEINVFKANGVSSNALAGAGFVLKNKDGKYYKMVTDANGNKSIVWTECNIPTNPTAEQISTIASTVDMHVSAADGNVPKFDGLTAGVYYLVEVQVPAGFNKADDVKVTINDKGEDAYSEKNLKHKEIVINQPGVRLPSTGGIGTTIFYIIGGLLIVAAAVFFVMRRRADAE